VSCPTILSVELCLTEKRVTLRDCEEKEHETVGLLWLLKDGVEKEGVIGRLRVKPIFFSSHYFDRNAMRQPYVQILNKNRKQSTVLHCTVMKE